MNSNYSIEVLKIVVARLCHTIGWHAIKPTALHVMVDILQNYLFELAKSAHSYAEHTGRHGGPGLADVSLALRAAGVSLPGLVGYVRDVAQVSFPAAVPRFPVAVASHRGFDADGGEGLMLPPWPPLADKTDKAVGLALSKGAISMRLAATKRRSAIRARLLKGRDRLALLSERPPPWATETLTPEPLVAVTTISLSPSRDQPVLETPPGTESRRVGRIKLRRCETDSDSFETVSLETDSPCTGPSTLPSPESEKGDQEDEGDTLVISDFGSDAEDSEPSKAVRRQRKKHRRLQPRKDKKDKKDRKDKKKKRRKDRLKKEQVNGSVKAGRQKRTKRKKRDKERED